MANGVHIPSGSCLVILQAVLRAIRPENLQAPVAGTYSSKINLNGVFIGWKIGLGMHADYNMFSAAVDHFFHVLLHHSSVRIRWSAADEYSDGVRVSLVETREVHAAELRTTKRDIAEGIAEDALEIIGPDLWALEDPRAAWRRQQERHL